MRVARVLETMPTAFYSLDRQWQFSYVNNWGNLAGAALNALLTVVAHDRFDTDFEANAEAVAVADEMLEIEPGVQP